MEGGLENRKKKLLRKAVWQIGMAIVGLLSPAVPMLPYLVGAFKSFRACFVPPERSRGVPARTRSIPWLKPANWVIAALTFTLSIPGVYKAPTWGLRGLFVAFLLGGIYIGIFRREPDMLEEGDDI